MNLIEVMVTLLIIAMVTAAVATNVIDAKKRAEAQDARLEVRQLTQAVESYRIRHPQLPDSLTQLVPADIKKLHDDPWGSPFVYERHGDQFEVRSLGPDRVSSEDDLRADEP